MLVLHPEREEHVDTEVWSLISRAKAPIVRQEPARSRAYACILLLSLRPKDARIADANAHANVLSSATSGGA